MKKTLSDVKVVSTVHTVRILKPIPCAEGALTGQTIFLGLNALSPPTQETLRDHRSAPMAKMSNRLKTRLQLKSKKEKKERRFPEVADINPELTVEQHQKVIKILKRFQDAFVSEIATLLCTDLEEHRIDTGHVAPIYIPCINVPKLRKR